MSKNRPTAVDLTSDPKNANVGTARGRALLTKSLRDYGAGRSILTDKNGVVIAGNKTHQAAAEIGLPVKVVETDGTELVVVQRTDLDLEHDPAARGLAYADNRVSQLDLEWNTEQLAADLGVGLDLSDYWQADELAALLHVPAVVDTSPAFQPTYTPETATAVTSKADMEKARKEMETQFAARLALKPIVCPHCAGEFFLDKDKMP